MVTLQVADILASMTVDDTVRNRLLVAFPFLERADSAVLERLLQVAKVVRLPAGQAVCHEGDRCSVLPLVLNGSTRVFKSGATGREITLYRLGQGESCVLTASCILSGSPFPASAACESDVDAVVIPAADVVAWLRESAAWREFLFGLVAHRLHRIINVIDDVVFLRMDQRLADYLLEQPGTEDGWLRLTHQQIADDLGTSREVVSRLLKDLEHRHLLEGGRGRLRLVDRDGLRAAAAAR